MSEKNIPEQKHPALNLEVVQKIDLLQRRDQEHADRLPHQFCVEAKI